MDALYGNTPYWLRALEADNEIKYSLSNASESTTVHRPAQMQGQRYWIERAFEDAKSQAGMGHYQARGWKSWNHHMALVMTAILKAKLTAFKSLCFKGFCISLFMVIDSISSFF